MSKGFLLETTYKHRNISLLRDSSVGRDAWITCGDGRKVNEIHVPRMHASGREMRPNTT